MKSMAFCLALAFGAGAVGVAVSLVPSLVSAAPGDPDPGFGTAGVVAGGPDRLGEAHPGVGVDPPDVAALRQIESTRGCEQGRSRGG